MMAYDLEQRDNGWYIVYVNGGELGPYPSKSMAQQAAMDVSIRRLGGRHT